MARPILTKFGKFSSRCKGSQTTKFESNWNTSYLTLQLTLRGSQRWLKKKTRCLLFATNTDCNIQWQHISSNTNSLNIIMRCTSVQKRQVVSDTRQCCVFWIFPPFTPKSRNRPKSLKLWLTVNDFRQLNKSSHNIILLAPFHLMLIKYDLISSYCVKN